MRIAITVDPELPVPPREYGGIERVVDLLVRGLMERGHEVTLFANRESTVCCELVPYEGRRSASWGDTARNIGQIVRRVVKGHYDLVHGFGRLAYMLPFLPMPIPKLMSYQREICPRSIQWGHRLSRNTLQFSACSRSMIRCVEHLGRWHVVYNAVGPDQYTFRSHVGPDAPFVFLGRIEHIKGTHLAIEIARRCGRELVIAGNVPAEHRDYFESRIRPHIDGSKLRYVGPVGNAQKNELLGRAAALLMPILWEEPFGIVMAESLACGTPVLGVRRGAVPEVVRDGENGFIGNDVEELVGAAKRINDIDRAACRRSMEERFSSTIMVSEYLRIYKGMTSRHLEAA